MRPPLNPAMGEIVICASVARQLTALYHRHGQEYDLSPATAASRAACDLPPDYPGMLRFALHSLSVYLNLGVTSHDWLSKVLEQAHYGSSFRRCFFFDYKENRCPYPRVTNRGVQVPSKAVKVRIRKGKVNA